MKKRQSAALERRKFFADPVLVVTIVLLTPFILYPLAMAVPGTMLGVGFIRGFTGGIFRTGLMQGIYSTGIILVIVFVADFIGEVNFLTGDIIKTDGGQCTLSIEERPVQAPNPEGFPVGKRCKVVLSCLMGAYQNYHLMVGDALVKLAD